jgi:hypothetical protein
VIPALAVTLVNTTAMAGDDEMSTIKKAPATAPILYPRLRGDDGVDGRLI